MGRDWESRGCQNESRLAGGGEPNAPPRSGETGGKGCRPAGRRGRHARGRPVLWSAQTGGTQPAPKRGRAGRAGAGTSASANAGVHAGVNAGHTMLDACGPHNSGRMQTCEQTTGGRDGTGHGRKGTTRHTDTVKAWTRLQRVMPSASLVAFSAGIFLGRECSKSPWG